MRFDNFQNAVKSYMNLTLTGLSKKFFHIQPQRAQSPDESVFFAHFAFKKCERIYLAVRLFRLVISGFRRRIQFFGINCTKNSSGFVRGKMHTAFQIPFTQQFHAIGSQPPSHAFG